MTTPPPDDIPSRPVEKYTNDRWFWEPIPDVETVMFSSIVAGLGVDDSIHLLVRFRKQRKHSPDKAGSGNICVLAKAVPLPVPRSSSPSA